jgi:hypothetical protein
VSARKWAALGGVLVVLLGACGPRRSTTLDTGTTTPATAGGTQTVTFGVASFDVPAAWPVYDLTAAPHRCARFDLHAVYRGHQAADAACPARALGKTEAVQIEANDSYAQARVLPSGPSGPSADIHGQAVAFEPGGAANHSIVATFPGLGVVLRVTYGADQPLAQQIVASVRKAGS